MGPSKRLGKRGHRGISEETQMEIENAVSEAMTDMNAPTYKEYSGKSGFDKMMDAVGNKAHQYQDTANEARVQKYKCGGTVKHGYAVGGDVRYNNRGKCY